jgi:ribosomal-protein-alanine N-acetyltransferase
MQNKLEELWFMSQQEQKFWFPPLMSDRLVLTPISHQYADFVVEHFLNPHVQEFLYDREPIDQPAQALEIIDFYLNAHDCSYNRWIVVRKDDLQPVGTCGFHKWDRLHKRAEIGYDLHPHFWGQGYMREAVAQMLNFGFNTMHLRRVEALVACNHDRSLHLLEQLGFEREGVLRNYFWYRGVPYDHYMLSLLA